MSTSLYYNEFKNDWLNALPLGNGKIAAMVYGNPDTDQISMNEESLWSGRQLEEKYDTSPDIMAEVRKLLFENKYEEATKLSDKHFLASPERVRFYETFCDIFINYADKRQCSTYEKRLEMSEGMVYVGYKKGDIFYRTESFVSEKYNLYVYRAHTENNEIFSCDISMDRTQDAYVASIKKNTLVLNGTLTYSDDKIYGEGGEGMSFGSRLYVKTDGKMSSLKKAIRVDDATYVEIYSAFETNYNFDKFDVDESIDYKSRLIERIDAIKTVDYDSIKADHLKTHKELFDRVSFELDAPKFGNVSIDRRMSKMKYQDEADLDFYSLYFNYGRYLLITSSGRNALLPANLQGKWCNEFTPMWGSDYHTNINLQMNYWHAESTNLSETALPLIEFMKKISEFGKDTAKKLYNAKGWVMHATTDIFGRTGVHDATSCGFFPMAGSWLCMNLWEHYEYTEDLEYLKDIYPVLKGSCEFVKDFLIKRDDGTYVTNPSDSPENHFYYYDEEGNKKRSMFTYGPTMDFEIIYAVFTRMIYACEILGVDKDFASSLAEIVNNLPPLRISERYGTVCEWIEDFEEVEPSHRHISHMFGLFPGDQINENDEKIYQAAKNTIARRLSFGGGATGWSRAWVINFYARLKDGNNAYKNLEQLIKNSTAENVFDMHPPFQIDGNFGATSGITEMLIQSHLGKPGERIIELLPALPDDWHSGSFKGLKTRGGNIVDVEWKDNKVVKTTITATTDNCMKLKLADYMKNVPKTCVVEDGILVCRMQKGDTLKLKF